MGLKVAKGAVNKAIQAEKKTPRFCKKWKKAAFCKQLECSKRIRLQT